ncbi:MAG TPA: PAS domain S-box protein [Verrucomicrobiae bacterium]|nr:PAS domain S-box protein [Verrucomicrobiae bacterium]
MNVNLREPDAGLLAHALGAVHVGITICDDSGRIAWVNDAFTRICGYSAEEVAGQHTRIFKSGKQDPSCYAELWNTVLGGNVYVGELINRRKDGTLYHERNTITPVTDAEGRRWFVAMKEDVTHQNAAKQALARSDERFRLLFEHAPDAYYLHDLEGVFLDGNKGAEAMIGYTRAELIGKKFSEVELLPAEFLGCAPEWLEQSRLGRPVGPLDLALKHKSGHLVPVEIRTYPVEVQGQVCVLGIARDIRERKTTEMRRGILAQLSEQLNTVLDLRSAATVIATATHKLIEADACSIDLNDAQGSSARRLFSDTTFEGKLIPMTPGLEASLEHQERFSPPLVIPIRNAGKVLGSISVRRQKPADFTDEERERLALLADHCGPAVERIGTREALSESEANYRSLIERLPDAVIVHVDGRIVFANPAAVQLVGAVDANDIVGRSVFDFAVPETRMLVEERILNTRAGKVSPLLELNVRKLNGAQFRAEVMSIPFTFKSMPAVQTILRDVTERRHIEQQLQQAQKLEAIGTLAGGIAHDFNNILGGIMGYTQLARMDAADRKEIRDNLDRVLQAADRAKQLVAQILTFSRKHALVRRPLRLHTVVNETLQLLRAALPATIECVTSVDSEAPPVVADATQIHQVLMNLCTNAGHALGMSAGARLEVRLACESFAEGRPGPDPRLTSGVFVRLTVADNGPGIRPEHLPRIFEPFFTTKSPWEGTGLGLAVVHGIVQDHGGVVLVSSTPGEGARFDLYFPASDQNQDLQADIPRELPRGKGESILLIDDEFSLADSGRRILERLGYSVTVELDPGRAIARFCQAPEKFAMVMTDLTMPGMTGADVAAAVLRCKPEVKVIVSTGYSTPASRELLEQCGVRDFIMKPVSAETLASIVRNVFDRRLNTGRKGVNSG